MAAQQEWKSLRTVDSNGCNYQSEVDLSICHVCQEQALWLQERMVIPHFTVAPMPHVDLPDELRADYMEARDIAARSPRGAAALLRVVVQKLMPLVGGQGRTLDDQIGYLAARGLRQDIVDMLDIVRDTGNHAVHISGLNMEDDPEVVDRQFWAVNEVTEDTIARQKRIAAGRARFSAGVQAGIAKRAAITERQLAAESPASLAPKPDDN